MSEFKENLKTVERLLKTAQICGEYTEINSLYDFLGIDKTATKDQIKAGIEENYKFYLSRRYVSGWQTLTKEFIACYRAIEYLLYECRPEYDNYLLDLGVKELRNRFIFLAREDRELDAKDKKQLIKEGLEMGLSETQTLEMIDLWTEGDAVETVEASSTSDSHEKLVSKTYYELFGVPNDADYSSIIKAYEREYNRYVHGKDKARWDRVSDGWEILKDSDKRAAYDQQLNQPEPEVEDGVPVLKVICKMDGYLYKDVKKGTQFTETIVIKNDHKGQLQGKIISDAEWLVPERVNLNYSPEQTLAISILSAKIPAGLFDAKGTITLDTNGGPPYLISFRIILKDLEEAVDNFRKTYAPLAAACAGFIGSFSRSPFLFAVISAVFTGILCYSMAKFIAKAALENGLNRLKLPSHLLQSAAAGMVVLTILVHSFGSSATKQEKLDISSLPEQPYAPAMLKVENTWVNRQFSQTDDSLSKGNIALSSGLTGMAAKTVSRYTLREFSLGSIDNKAHEGFECSDRIKLDFHCADWTTIRTQPNPLALNFPSQDWNFVQKSPKDSRCDKSSCPLAIAAEPDANAPKPRLAGGLKKPSVQGGYVTASRINARLASSTAKSKKWKPKTSSFAPPSRDDL